MKRQFLNPTPNPKNSPLGPQKVKNDPKIESKSNVRIKGNMENESCSLRIVFEPYPNPKKSLLRPQKLKNYPKIKQKQISEFTETYKMRIVQLYE